MRPFRFAAILWMVIALAVNAYIHLTLAPTVAGSAVGTGLGVDAGTSGTVMSLSTLYLVEAAFNALAALFLIVRPRAWSAVFAILVALAGLGTLVASVWIPLHLPAGLPTVPMSSWTTEKAISAAAQFVVVVSGTFVALTSRRS